jgi:hypothetical protein
MQNSGIAFKLQLFPTLALAILGAVLGTTPKAALGQSVEPISPLPNGDALTPDSAIDLRLTEQPKIKLDTIAVLVNGTPVSGNISIDTSNLSLRFQGTPASYNLGTNTLEVKFETQSGIQSQFTWPFSVGAAAVPATPTTTTTTPSDTTNAATPVATTTIPLKPELTTQSVTGNTLVLEGKTQPGATVSVAITATRPAEPLVDIGPFVITSNRVDSRQMSGSGQANGDGTFRLEFDVVGDPAGTEYAIQTTSSQGSETATTASAVTR